VQMAPSAILVEEEPDIVVPTATNNTNNARTLNRVRQVKTTNSQGFASILVCLSLPVLAYKSWIFIYNFFICISTSAQLFDSIFSVVMVASFAIANVCLTVGILHCLHHILYLLIFDRIAAYELIRHVYNVCFPDKFF
jgi:hypothetical protein